ncbi:hypothetical protein ACWEK5_41405 [Rhodococcus koreensis]
MSASTRDATRHVAAAAVSIAHAATATDSPVVALWAFLLAGLGAHAAPGGRADAPRRP